MKAQFLKLAGVKNEKEFYKKFPTEESFMAKHGAVLKAQYGDQIPPMVDTSLGTVAGGANRFNLNMFGMQNQNIPQGIGYQQQNYFAKQNPFATNTVSQNWAKNNPAVGNQLPESIAYNADLGAKKTIDTKKGFQTGIGFVDKTISGFKALKAEKKALKNARIWRDVSGIARKASETVDVDARNQIADTAARTRKALMPTITGEELYPVDGVGTNVLAKHGKKFQSSGEIMNTFAPGDIYQDLGYETYGDSETGFSPLPDSEVIKAYRSGGLVPRFQGGGGMGGGFDFSSMFSGMMGGGSGGSGGGMGGMFGGMMGGGGSGGASGGASGGGMGGVYGMIGNQASGMIGSSMDNNAGTQIGGGIGEGIGSIFGPVGGMIGNIVGTAAGGLLDKNPGKTKRAQGAMMGNIKAMTGMENIKAIQGGYSGSMKDGGYMSWENPNPRVITHFGGQNLSKLLAHANDDMDTLRSGGNIRSNENGDIKIDGRRGELEHISFNPYTPGTGVTSMIKGPSHDRGGVNVSYNGNMVEAEGGEPISERQDGGSVGTTAVITGDQTFNKMGANEIPELSEYEGKKVKHIQKILAEKDAKLNKLQTKNSLALSEFNPRTQIDKLTFNSLAMNEKGIGEQYKRNALKTESLITYQDAINQEAERMGVDAGELSRGKIKPLPFEEMMSYKEAMNGISLAQAQHGINYSDRPKTITKTKTVVKTPSKLLDVQEEPIVPNTKDLPPVPTEVYDKLQSLYKEAEKHPNKKSPETLAFQKYYHEVAPDYAKAVLGSEPITTHGKAKGISKFNPESNEDSIFGKRTKQYMAALKKADAAKVAEAESTAPSPEAAADDVEGVFETSPYQKYGWETLAAQLMPWLRKTPGEPLLGDQLAGELYAMSHNQVEPVQARFYHPQLDVPYDISFQDRLNENQATFNALERAAGQGNPEALSMLAGQKYGADSNVLAEQFRANQAKKDQVYSQNRATLNDAQLKNLSIADQQYVRQAQAKSNTKMAMQEAINSVAAKIGQNRLENRTLQTYANMFPDFSYGKDYTIRKTGAPTTFNMPVVYNAAGDITHVALYDDDGKIYDYRELTPSESKKMGKKKTVTEETRQAAGGTPGINATAKERNGGLIRAFKNF